MFHVSVKEHLYDYMQRYELKHLSEVGVEKELFDDIRELYHTAF